MFTEELGARTVWCTTERIYTIEKPPLRCGSRPRKAMVYPTGESGHAEEPVSRAGLRV